MAEPEPISDVQYIRRCDMMCGSGCGEGMRGFFTKEEKVKMLREYKKSLENEAKGVEERIKDLERKQN